jgi:ADP-ribose pyrophosphatase YjhB (NUDIX family)
MLFIKKEHPTIGTYYAQPGGAVEPNETLEEALKRECKEELGFEVSVSRFVCIREYIEQP